MGALNCRGERPTPQGGGGWQIQGLTQGVAWGGLSLLDDLERCLPVSGREGAPTLLLSGWEKIVSLLQRRVGFSICQKA